MKNDEKLLKDRVNKNDNSKEKIEKKKNKNINEFDTLVYQFLDFASRRFSAVEKQFIYLHYFLGVGVNELKEGFYDFTYNCTYCMKNAFVIDKKIKNKLMYVFTNVVEYKHL